MRTRLTLIAIVLAAPVVMYAQSASPDVLSALLQEVHQLRLTLEQSAITTPRIQLLASRLAVQNERTSRAAHDLEAVRQELARLGDATSRMSTEVQELETALGSEADPARRKEMTSQQTAMKLELQVQSGVEQRLRARENELANAYLQEQGAWAELNRRLDELERELVPRKQP